jgi:hypothetical protein
MRSRDLATVLNLLDADLIAVVEGPNTLADRTVTASRQLSRWMEVFEVGGDRGYDVIEGFASRGQQELCVIYDANKLTVEHAFEGRNRFDEPFLVDTLEQSIKERYEHYRPPLEALVKEKGTLRKLFKLIVMHAKSKGIFDRVDYARYEQLSELNRRKLYAECMHVRQRVDQWLKEGDQVIVTGDINDGMGSDFYEGRFGKSAIELLLGSVYEPELILKSSVGKPKLKRYGWTPSSSNFVDKITGDEFNVLIDHILLSQKIGLQSSGVMNPYGKAWRDTLSDEIKGALKRGADHFPVFAEVEV